MLLFRIAPYSGMILIITYIYHIFVVFFNKGEPDLHF